MVAPGLLKRAASDSLTSSTGATATAPLPTPSIEPTFAPGKRGPSGLSPRQNYSRVNTGAPPQMDAGSAEQKAMPPRGAEMLPKRAAVGGEELMGKMAGRPMLQDLVKAAMVDSASRVRISEEAALQYEKTAEKEKCSKCGKEKCACGDKAASSQKTAGQHVEKLASALDFIAGELLKEGEVTSPPGVSAATASTSLPDHKGQGVNTVPMHPGQQKGLKTEQGATQMDNTLDHAPQLHKHQIQNNSGKSASVAEIIRTKLAEAAAEKKETEGLTEVKKGLEKTEKAHESEPENKKEGTASLADYMAARVKQAADANNPAHISAGAAVPPDTSAAGESGGAPAGGPPQGPTSHIATSEAAINATKGETHGPRREELKKYFVEPALSAEHDKVLQVAFENTGKAGTKFASAPAPSVQTAAARVLLSKLAESIDQKNGDTAAQGA